MTKRRGGGGGGGPLKTVLSFLLWAVLLGSIIFAFFGIPHDATAKDLPEIVKSKSNSIQIWFDNCFPKIVSGEDSTNCLPAGSPGTIDVPPGETPPPTDAPAPPAESPAPAPVENPAATILSTLRVEEHQNVNYDRDEWDHWNAAPGAAKCFSVRQQVLLDEATPGSVVFVDKKKNVVTDFSQACNVQSGEWIDPYSGETFTNPKDLDVDHMIPLGYAAKHGGQAWTPERKTQYANDLSNSYHLVAVKASENRAKSDRGPSEWKPKNQAHWCQYATDWVNISKNYDLSVTPADATALGEMLATC